MKHLILLFAGLASLCIGLLIYAIVIPEFSSPAGVASIVFWVLSVALIGAFVAINANEVGNAVRGRSAYEGFNMFFGIAVALIIAIVIYLLADRRSVTFDYTEAQKFTLAPYTYNLIENLEEPIELLYMLNPIQIQANTEAENLMRLYSDHSDMITYEMIDPESEPQKVAGISSVTLGSIYVNNEDVYEKVSPVNENNLTNALLKVTQGEQEVVYFTTGHGEPSIDEPNTQDDIGRMAQILESEGYRYEAITLFEMDEVPEDAAVLVIAGAQTPFLETELETLKNYLDQGGDAIFLIDPPALDRNVDTGLEAFLFQNYGILLGENWVIENNPMAKLFGGQPHTPMMSSITPHPITDAFGGGAQAIMFPIVRSVQATETAPDGVEVTEIIQTSPRSWGETDFDEMASTGTVGFDQEVDLEGPIPIAVAATRTIPLDETDRASDEPVEDDLEAEAVDEEARVEELDTEAEMRLVVFGDSDFITNQLYASSIDLFVNSINWMTEQEDLISIRPKDDSGEPIFLSQVDANLLFYIPILVVPGLVAIIGTFVVLMRRMIA